MDRNENQNAYENMVSKRGNSKEMKELKHKIDVLTIIILILAALVIAMGFIALNLSFI